MAGWGQLLPSPLPHLGKGGLYRKDLGMPKTALLGPALGLQPPRLGSPSFAKGVYVRVSQSGVPDPLRPHGLLCPWDFPGKNSGAGFHSFLQRIFPSQGSNPGLLHCRQILYHLRPGKPCQWDGASLEAYGSRRSRRRKAKLIPAPLHQIKAANDIACAKAPTPTPWNDLSVVLIAWVLQTQRRLAGHSVSPGSGRETGQGVSLVTGVGEAGGS